MGLDQYLTKKTYIGANYEHRKITGKIEIYKDGKLFPINFKKVSYIIETAGYWRTANQIHNWFVTNVQNGVDDCNEYEVTKEQLKELLELCIKVRDESVLMKAEMKIGTTYMQDIEDTIEILTPLLKEDDNFEVEYHYQSLW